MKVDRLDVTPITVVTGWESSTLRKVAAIGALPTVSRQPPRSRQQTQECVDDDGADDTESKQFRQRKRANQLQHTALECNMNTTGRAASRVGKES
jgi:hypothetical protein